MQTELKKFSNNKIENNYNIITYDFVEPNKNWDSYDFYDWWMKFFYKNKIDWSFLEFKLNFDFGLQSFHLSKRIFWADSYDKTVYYKENPFYEPQNHHKAEKFLKLHIDDFLDLIEKYKKTEKAKVEIKNLKAEIKK